MTVRVVRLGERRFPNEGIRIGTVRRPPRGVRKERYASDDWFDVWYPDLAPSAKLMKQGKAAMSDVQWKSFVRAFKVEMDAPSASRTLDLLAALSHGANLSIGCYCENEARCHVCPSPIAEGSRRKSDLAAITAVRISYPTSIGRSPISPLVKINP